jgi:hypothetical protein
MRKTILLFTLTLLLTACSTLQDLSNLLPGADPTASPTLVAGEPLDPTTTSTPTETPTRTPVPSTATLEFTATPRLRPTITLPPVNLREFTPSSPIFSMVLASGDLIRWGACGGTGPFEITFTVKVRVPQLHYVLLFMRLQDKYTNLGTDWGGGAIMNGNNGTYTYTVTTDNISRYEDFEDAWLQYQIVAADRYRKVLGRSLIYQDDISITHCPTPTPKP